MVERVAQSRYFDSGARSTAQGRKTYEIAKRALDLVIAIPGLLIAVPLILLIGFALKLDTSGPVFFRQERVGRFGKPFRILKFRTMFWPPQPSLHRQHISQLAGERESASDLRIAEDPRVTRVGRFLRRWSLDELPNLWNVIRGDMSLVGPRPLVAYEAEVVGDDTPRRLSVKPGITGLAQINGRLDVSPRQRSDDDGEYLSRRSLLFDLWILLRTPLILFTRSGV